MQPDTLQNAILTKSKLFHKWVKAQAGNFAEVVDFHDKKAVHIDLSVSSLVLGNNSNFEDIQRFERTIQHYLEDRDAELAWGGYAETRPFYTTDAYQTNGENGAQWRTVHLGMDFWAAAETPVFAPLEGSVHSFEDNKGDCNYGPTIILQHEVSEQLTFFTLYGHLTLNSLDGLEVGMKVKKGQQIAKIGSSKVNGNWPPHLHFQIILDILGEKGDFAGVAYPHEKEFWLKLCPNPALFFPNLQSPIAPIKSVQEILQARQHHLGKSLSVSYQKPLHIVRAYKQYLYDTNARRYLDTVNNVAHVGHQHPRIVRAAQRQIAVLNTNTRYLHENIVLFAEELLATFPPELSVVHFVNSGSEANELALRMVKTCTERQDILAIEVGYHGNTSGCIDISSYKFNGKGGKGKPPQTHLLPIPDVYRGLYRDSETAGKQYASHASKIIERLQNQGKKIGGFIAESVLSCGGQVMLPEGYLKEVYQIIRAQGGLCIADEVQVGLGRIGEKFWAFELQDVVPDIVTLGKPLGNGHPLAAVVTTQEVAEKFANGMEYFNTFGGNPVSCAIGREVLKVVQEEELQKNALEVGAYLRQQLKQLQSHFPIIGDVRGIGLFQGFELVKNPETLEPAADEATFIANRMCERGILMSTDGLHHNVLKLKPPMCFTKRNVDFLVENLGVVLDD